MSDPIMTPKKPGDPAVVDIRDGDWKFGYQGILIKKALYEKVGSLEEASEDLLNQIEREIGTETKGITSLMVAMHAPTMSVKARYIKALCERVIELEKSRANLSRAAKGFNDEMVYVISLADMEEMGL